MKSLSKKSLTKTYALTGAVIAILAINGCTNKEAASVTGAALGGLVGSTIGAGQGKLFTVAIGSLAGAFVGDHIGSKLDEQQQKMVARTANNSLENNIDGQAATWKDPNTATKATVTPTRSFQTSQGAYCREFQQDIKIAGQTERGYGTACRKPDGSWEIVG